MVKKLELRSTNPAGLILLSAALITLYINPGLEDPFNSPKQWLLIIFGSWIAGLLTTLKSSDSEKSLNYLKIILLSLILSLVLATAFTDVKYTAIFGEVQRRIGLITYLFFAIYLFASSKFIRYSSISKLFYANAFLATAFVIYGYMQTTGNDFVQWDNPYNSIILTLGNPNFASALMAIFATLCLTAAVNDQTKTSFKLINILLALCLLHEIYLSNSRQGIVAFLLAFSVLFTVACFNRNKKLGALALSVSMFAGLMAVLGMLQIGFLTEFLYKGSVSIRGFYWRAGFEMFQSKPFTGIGVERYGSYFKEFREVEYPLRYGFDITSTNAHSVPIQMFATGGIFVGLSYLSLISYILYRGLVALRKYSGNQRLTVAGIFSAWLAFQAQSIISIDNIGLTIWGWILGGIVIGLSNFDSGLEQQSVSIFTKVKNYNFSLAQPLISGLISLIAVLLISVLYRGEAITMEVKKRFNVNSSTQSADFFQQINKAFETQLIEPYYKLRLVDILATTQNFDLAIDQIQALNEADPRNLDVLKVYANLLEFNRSFDQAVELRKQIAIYDPWDATNYLNLGRNYKAKGDWTNMEAMRSKIISFAPQTNEANLANSELIKS
jgi:tetratricopeptide (TPR) repeat protein